MSSSKAIIIGSGIAGIAAAIRLSHKGYQVSVYEANTYPGGKLSEITKEGFRFDAGPSLFTLPEQVAELFALCGENIQDHFAYKQLDIACKYFWEDGTVISASSDQETFATQVAEQLKEPKANVQRALAQSAKLYDTLAPLFMHKSLHELQTWIGKDARKAYLKLPGLGLTTTMNKANERLFNHPKLVQLFNRYATYNGSNPYETPATLNIIPHLEFNIGAFFPKKGMYDITMSLYQLAKRQGASFHFGQKVDQILLEGKVAKGIKVAEEEIYADLVVTNMDMVNTYKYLLPADVSPKKLLNQPKSSSALIFYWGIQKVFDQLELHNIFFSDNYEAEFSHIFDKKTIYHDPTVYVNITSVEKPDDAPEGCMNWFTMINVPNNSGQDWDRLISEAKKNILSKLSRILGEDIEKLIVVEEILEPRTIELKTSSAQGALYGNSSNNRFAAFLRHANAPKSFENLYFCGGSVHPGGGIPLSLLSAKIMADYIPSIS